MSEPTTPSSLPPPTMNRIFAEVLSQVKSARSPLLSRRYKNFGDISGKDDTRIQDIYTEQDLRNALSVAECLVCVTYSAKWCGPWRMIRPDVHRLSHIHSDVLFLEVDVDVSTELATSRKVTCMPTFQFYKSSFLLDSFAEPNRIKLDETIRKLRKVEVLVEEDKWPSRNSIFYK